MNERGWFTLLVRGTGLWFTLSSIRGVGSLLINIGFVWYEKINPTPGNVRFPSTSTISISGNGGAVLSLLAGLSLLFFGGRLIDWLCRSVVGRCVACGHRLSGEEPVCPECGVRSSPAS
ncbi:MAG: hypothetical protein ACIARR_07910 [Phycisphaerales bacterium JB059]